MKEIFPDAEIIKERWLGMAKSDRHQAPLADALVDAWPHSPTFGQAMGSNVNSCIQQNFLRTWD
jgi:hypothetical protein